MGVGEDSCGLGELGEWRWKGEQLRSGDEVTVNRLFSLTVRVFYSSSFRHAVVYPSSAVRNKPPRKAVAENLGF